jgi:hypothetical protein
MWKWAHFRGRARSPYPDHYIRAFASSTILYPLTQQVALRLPCHATEVPRRMVGLTVFHVIDTSGLGSAFIPMVLHPRSP